MELIIIQRKIRQTDRQVLTLILLFYAIYQVSTHAKRPVTATTLKYEFVNTIDAFVLNLQWPFLWRHPFTVTKDTVSSNTAHASCLASAFCHNIYKYKFMKSASFTHVGFFHHIDLSDTQTRSLNTLPHSYKCFTTKV